jgi:hypothetical protein
LPSTNTGDSLTASISGCEGMARIVQLDLFGDRPDLGGPLNGAFRKTVEPERLSVCVAAASIKRVCLP